MAEGANTKALVGAAGAGAGGFTGGVPSITSSSSARAQTDFKSDNSGWSVYTGSSTNKSGSLSPAVIALAAAAVVAMFVFMKRKG